MFLLLKGLYRVLKIQIEISLIFNTLCSSCNRTEDQSVLRYLFKVQDCCFFFHHKYQWQTNNLYLIIQHGQCTVCVCICDCAVSHHKPVKTPRIPALLYYSDKPHTATGHWTLTVKVLILFYENLH